MSDERYFIALGSDVWQLCIEVHLSIQEGYYPTGGPFRIKQEGDLRSDCWGQAMFKPDAPYDATPFTGRAK
jgi:hypothetical protein